MDYRVIKFFIDRDSLKGFNAGDTYPCADLDRAAQLIHRGYIVREEASQEEDPKDEPKDKPEPKKKTTTAKAKTAVKKAANKKKA